MLIEFILNIRTQNECSGNNIKFLKKLILFKFYFCLKVFVFIFKESRNTEYRLLNEAVAGQSTSRPRRETTYLFQNSLNKGKSVFLHSNNNLSYKVKMTIYE